MIIIGEERRWTADTNNERFKVVMDKGVEYGTHWYVIEYDTDGRRQTIREQGLEENTVLLTSPLHRKQLILKQTSISDIEKLTQVFDLSKDTLKENDSQLYYAILAVLDNEKKSNDVKLYWVSAIVEHDGDKKPCLLSINQAELGLDKAMEVVERIKKDYTVLSIWIDVFDKQDVKSTVYHECYLNAFGDIG